MATSGRNDAPPVSPDLTENEAEQHRFLSFLLTELDRMRERGLITAQAFKILAAETRSRREAIAQGALERARRAHEALRLKRAREALVRGDVPFAVAYCLDQLERQPEPFDAIVLLAAIRERQASLDQALVLYQRANALRPRDPILLGRILGLQERIAARLADKPASTPEDQDQNRAPVSIAPVVLERDLSWSSVAGEFLEDHWQKLILSLAVLLIVVGSNIGAYQLLGPLLWSDVGKCVLALVYTAMFAGFGVGLAQWGAERAGRIMQFVTLLVASGNFLLAGQLRLLETPTAWHYEILAVDAAALYVLIWVVARSLGLGRPAGVLSAGLFAMGALSAAVAPGSHWPWSAQLALYLAGAAVFLGSVAWLTTGARDSARGDPVEATCCLLGPLAFAFSVGSIRTGVFLMDLIPTLHAIPVMAAAIACVLTAEWLDRFEPGARRNHWARFAGIVLSGLAMALALARPPGLAPLYSGNTLAASLLGLALYAALLRSRRGPPYLYFGFGALVAAYFNTHDFARDLIVFLEPAARLRLLSPPEPYRALNGLVLSPLVAALAIFVRRRWQDEPLAKHCHYLGVVFSVSACVYSGFEPQAAVICLSGYALLYAAAVWVFRAPWVVYLATTALAGAAYFAVRLWADATIDQLALDASVLGLFYWLVAALLEASGVGRAYRRPLDQAALALAAPALLGATLAIVAAQGSVSLTAATVFLVVALIATLVNRDEPGVWKGALAVVCGNAGLAFLAIAAGNRWRGGLTPIELDATAAAIGLMGAALGSLLHWVHAKSASVFPRPLFRASALATGVALWLCGVDAVGSAERLTTADFTIMAVVMGLAGLALVLLSSPYPVVVAAHLTIACGLGLVVCLARVIQDAPFDAIATHGALCAVYALGLIAVMEAGRAFWSWDARDKGEPAPFPARGRAQFARALPVFVECLAVVAPGLAAWGLTNGPETILTFAAAALAMLWATRLRHDAWLVHVGMVLLFATALLLTDWRIGRSDLGALLAGLALTSAACALGFWGSGRGCAAAATLNFYATPCAVAAALATWPVLALAPAARVFSRSAYPQGATAFGLCALALVLLAGDRRRAFFTYRAVLAAVLAVYLVIVSLDSSSSDPAYVLGLVAISVALVLSTIGFGCRSAMGGDSIEWLFARPLFHWALLLTLLAVAPTHHAPRTMLAVALSFLLMIKALPARWWIYPTVASVGCSFYYGMLIHQPMDRIATAAMLAAYALWWIALVIKSAEPSLIRWFRLPQRGYDMPLFNSAAAVCAIASALRLIQTSSGPLAWNDWSLLALAVSGFMILMIKPYPYLEWVHAAAALAAASAALAAYPRIESVVWWAPLAMALANLWWIAARFVAGPGRPIPNWLGLSCLEFSITFRIWSLVSFVLAALAADVVVIHVPLAAFAGVPVGLISTNLLGWLAIPLALALGAVTMVESWWSSDRAGTVMGLNGALVLAVWWMGSPASPLIVWMGVEATHFLPLATAGLAIATIATGLGLVGRGGERGESTGLDDETGSLEDFAASVLTLDLALVLLAGAMTRFLVDPITVHTLVLASLAAGLATLVRGSTTAAYIGSLMWCAAGIFAALDEARGFGVGSDADLSVVVAIGLLAALFVLWVVAGLDGSRREPGAAARIPAGSVALALEQSALLAGIVAAAMVGASAFESMVGDSSESSVPSPWAAVLAVVVLCGLALFVIGLIVRWGDEWLVYPAQALILGGYLYYRWAFAISPEGDAAVLTLFGGLNLGIAEAMHRVGLERFARPARAFSLALPLLPLGLGLAEHELGEMRLFFLFSAATFYAIAALSMQRRPLGYASAAFYDAFLWMFWSRIGWTLEERPQFFLIPVGLTAILFAEFERRSLDRESANTIRGVGLALIYLSLALPIWRFASLGAWITLLLVSLLGVLIGIGLRIQVFLWLGLVGFVLDVVYQLGRMGMEHTLVKWAVMLALGLLMIFFVALNEKKRIVPAMRLYLDQTRHWD